MKNKLFKVLKWAPVAFAGIFAVVEAIGDKQNAEKMEEFEKRITYLETKED